MTSLPVRVCLLVVLIILLAGSVDAESGDYERVLSLINQSRASVGLTPLASNAQLAAAAQAHADDMAKNGVGLGHLGSDGSTAAMRILRAGYHPYSWGLFAGENWAAYRTIEQSMSAWMSDKPHRDNILRPEYREIGVGAALSQSGAPILVTDFGAQPNALPVFLDGSGSSVTLSIANEDAVPGGDGPNVIGRALSVEISTDPAFSGAHLVPYSPTLRFSSPDSNAVTTIYVRFHDAQGRTAVATSSTSTAVVAPAAVTSSTFAAVPTRQQMPTRRPSTTRTATPVHTSATPIPATSTSIPHVDPIRGAEVAFATPVPSAIPNLRRPVNTPGYVDAVEAENASEPTLISLAFWLFAGGGLLLMIAVVIALRFPNR